MKKSPEIVWFQGSVIENIPISTKNGSILIFCEVMRINCLCREHLSHRTSMPVCGWCDTAICRWFLACLAVRLLCWGDQLSYLFAFGDADTRCRAKIWSLSPFERKSYLLISRIPYGIFCSRPCRASRLVNKKTVYPHMRDNRFHNSFDKIEKRLLPSGIFVGNHRI